MKDQSVIKDLLKALLNVLLAVMVFKVSLFLMTHVEGYTIEWGIAGLHALCALILLNQR